MKFSDAINDMRVRAGMAPLPKKEEWQVEGATNEELADELKEAWDVTGGGPGSTKVTCAVEVDIHKKVVRLAGVFNDADDPALKRLQEKYGRWEKTSENMRGHVVQVGYK